MKKYILIALVIFGAYQHYTKLPENKSALTENKTPRGFTGERHNQLIMYSLTTCGYCKIKAKELRAASIPYTEYYLDRNQQKWDELEEKLAKARYPTLSGNYGTPLFDAYGFIVYNNPSIDKLLSYKNKSI